MLGDRWCLGHVHRFLGPCSGSLEEGLLVSADVGLSFVHGKVPCWAFFRHDHPSPGNKVNDSHQSVPLQDCRASFIILLLSSVKQGTE